MEWTLGSTFPEWGVSLSYGIGLLGFEVWIVDYCSKRETGVFLRGRRTPSTFQEVWWFRLGFGGWRLSKIEQTAETSVLEMTDVNEVPISAGSGNGLSFVRG